MSESLFHFHIGERRGHQLSLIRGTGIGTQTLTHPHEWRIWSHMHLYRIFNVAKHPKTLNKRKIQWENIHKTFEGVAEQVTNFSQIVNLFEVNLRRGKSQAAERLRAGIPELRTWPELWTNYPQDTQLVRLGKVEMSLASRAAVGDMNRKRGTMGRLKS